MRKYIKKTLSVVLATALAFTSVSLTDGIGSKDVYAVSNIDDWQNKDETIVDGTMIRDSNLLKALKSILGNSFTAAQLKAYTGVIDLSGKSNIHDVTGLGYAMNAKEINLSGTSVQKIYKNEFLGCKVQKVTLPEGITELEAYAFSQCSQLKEINLPETLTRINTGAFNK